MLFSEVCVSLTKKINMYHYAVWKIFFKNQIKTEIYSNMRITWVSTFFDKQISFFQFYFNKLTQTSRIIFYKKLFVVCILILLFFLNKYSHSTTFQYPLSHLFISSFRKENTFLQVHKFLFSLQNEKSVFTYE